MTTEQYFKMMIARVKQLSNKHKEQKAIAKEAQQRAAIATTKAENAEQALSVAREVAQGVQQRVHKQISEIVTLCLQAVFEDPYEFDIIFEQKRGKTEARMVFVRDGMEIDPLAGAGLGVADVACLALRTAALVLGQPPLRRLLVLDEPFKFLSAEHREAIGVLLDRLSEKLDIQFIIVTHLEELQLGKVIKIT